MSIIINPFLTYEYDAYLEDDFEGEQREMQKMFERNNAIEDFLEGKLDPDSVLDLLEEHQINPADYVASVTSQLDWLMRHGHVPDDMDTLGFYIR